MVLLGVDPGTRFSGFGVLKKEKRKVFLLDYGYLPLYRTKCLIERIEIFHDFFLQKSTKWGVTDLAIETPFLGKNAQNFLKLGYLRGILYLISRKNNIKIHEFSPREIKLSVTGFGGASKEQLSRVVLQLFPGIKVPKRDDVTDALAVSLCGLWEAEKRVGVV